ncbi:MAG TPA: ABC transporter permease [bacterium]|nr:ABC transporter permease [bacterium]
MNKKFAVTRALAIAFKETRHILRDPYTLALAIFLPVFLVVYFGIAIDFNLRNLRLAVFDRDQSRASRQLVETFGSSGFFKVEAEVTALPPTKSLESESAKAVLLVEPRFGRDVGRGGPAKAQVLLDGADNSAVGTILGYLGGIEELANRLYARQAGVRPPPPSVDLQARYLFNPELSTQWFIVPGLSVVVLAILSTLLTALTVAREWENGSMEMLLATPVTPLEIILGKLAPYVGMGLLIQLVIYLVARLGFGIPFRGSHLLLLAGSLLFITACLAQGLLISVAVRQQRLAMQFAMITSMLPAFLLSGFIFPVENMPRFFQWFSAILPARWFMGLIRQEFLMGPAWGDLLDPFLALGGLNGLLILQALRSFKKDVEP